jgi:GNAT acetyltransferase-like protein
VNLKTISPLSDSRWDELVARHPRASVFHERGWLEALSRTYGYEPFLLTSAPAGKPLCDGIVLCRVSSWITGTRLVSLPFADHCELLLNDLSECSEFVNWLRAECDRQQWKYVELRPLSWNVDSERQMLCSSSYFSHSLDLTASLEHIFRGLHKNCIQRRIRRAERAGLTYEAGCSRKLLDEFYGLLLKTRRRHHLIPQPRTWFRNLMECMGDKMRIRVARKANAPVAALLTLRHRSSVVYKYGCSDERFHALAGMPFLFWRLIEESKAAGAESIDFGRSDVDDDGLITFKDRFGTSKKLLRYFRYSPAGKHDTATRWDSPAMRRLFSILPDAVLPWAGRILYRHIG